VEWKETSRLKHFKAHVHRGYSLIVGVLGHWGQGSWLHTIGFESVALLHNPSFELPFLRRTVVEVDVCGE
jgi:hypothetical protein